MRLTKENFRKQVMEYAWDTFKHFNIGKSFGECLRNSHRIHTNIRNTQDMAGAMHKPLSECTMKELVYVQGVYCNDGEYDKCQIIENEINRRAGLRP